MGCAGAVSRHAPLREVLDHHSIASSGSATCRSNSDFRGKKIPPLSCRHLYVNEGKGLVTLRGSQKQKTP